jgi:hypothetical protein
MKKLILLLMTIPVVSFGQSKIETWPPEIKSDQIHTYKKTEAIDLNLWVFNPPKHNLSTPKPAIIFSLEGVGEVEHLSNLKNTVII